jgi:hypothetical protein
VPRCAGFAFAGLGACDDVQIIGEGDGETTVRTFAEAEIAVVEHWVKLDQLGDAVGLKRDADGGITLHVQNASPGADAESNWLPAPNGPFFCVLRLYWPKPEALDTRWKPPQMQQAS